MDRALEINAHLVDSLENLVKMYRGLLELIRKEKDLLVSANTKELDESNRTKEHMLAKIKLAEQTRMKIARDLAKEVGSDVDAPRLLELATNLPEEHADRLRNLHGVLDLLLRRVSNLNRENEALAQSALQTVNGAIDSLKDSLQDKVTYERKGAMQSQSMSAGQLFRKEV
jgi:hypothetical protein